MDFLKYPDFFYTKDDEKIFYNSNVPATELKGDEIVFVFNYGLVCSLQHFREQLSYFHNKGIKLLVYHYRGHYSSSGEEDLSKINFVTFVEDLKGIIDKFEIKNIVMIGHSMGVNVTLEYAKRYPITGMVLISGTVLAPQDVMFHSNIMDILLPYIEQFAHSFPQIWKIFWKYQGFNPLVQILIRKGGFNEGQVSLEYVQEYLNKMGQLHPYLFFHLIQLMKEHDIINHLEAIQTPALIIGGDKDIVIPNYLQHALHSKLPHSELYIVKDGSHVPNKDFPEFINERIESFVDGLKSKTKKGHPNLEQPF